MTLMSPRLTTMDQVIYAHPSWDSAGQELNGGVTLEGMPEASQRVAGG
jgi:hypothetical protein